MTIAPHISQVYRQDSPSGGLLAPVERADGSLLLEGFLARPGVLTYRNADGTTTRELVTPETLADPEWLLTVSRATVTLEHPTTQVDAANWSEHAVGDIDGEVDVVRETGFNRVRLAARRADAVAAIKTGRKRGLSPGYVCQLDATPGVHPQFGAYDAIQRDRRCNHVAVCGSPRGGPSIVLRADAAEEVSMPVTLTAEQLAKLPEAIRTLHTDGLALSEFAAAALMQLLAEHEELEVLKGSMSSQVAEMDAMKGQLADLTGERDRHKGMADAMCAENGVLKGKIAEMDSKFAGMVPKGDALADRIKWASDRSRLVALATDRKVKLDAIDTLDNPGIARAIAKAVRPERADASDEYVAGMLDSLPATSDPWREVGDRLVNPRRDAADGPVPWKQDADKQFDARKAAVTATPNK